MMMRTAFLFLSATLLAAPASRAQSPAAVHDLRWSPWLGCWTPAATSRADSGTQVCIVPSADARGVRIVTFSGDTELLDETTVADGSHLPAAGKDCTGERSVRWAAHGPRLYTSSTLTCSGQPALRTSGLMSLVAPDRWMDVQVTTTEGREQVRTRRFWRSSMAPPAPVASLVQALVSDRLVVPEPSADDVIEASANLPSVGVEAWLAESGAHVRVDRRILVQLSRAKVSANVIDLMVALAFPRKFEVHRTSTGGAGVFGLSGGEDINAGWSYVEDVYGFGLGCFSSPYCFGYGDYYPGDGWYVEPPGGGGGGGVEPPTHGQVVNGYGYTRVQPRQDEHVNTGQGGGSQTAASGSSADSGGSGGGSSGGSSAGGASPAGYSGGGAGTGLTAVPR